MSSKTQTTASEEESTTALVPKLRFQEFREADGWEQKEVGEVFQVTRGDVLSMTLVRDEKTEATPYPVYSSQTKNNGLSGFYSEYLFADAITWTTDGANAGDVNYRTGKFFCTNVCGVLVSSKGFANSCIAALINSVARKYVSYVGNPKLMNGVMSKIPIPVPSLPEQQKIAECLSSVDDLIAAQARKVDALKTHKKGLMQQLFPREGETQPRLRFPEFQNAGEWELKKLEDIGRVIRGASPRPKGDPRYYGGTVPRLMVQDVTRDGKWVTPQIDYLTEEGVRLSRPCPAGTLTIVCSGSVGVVSFLAVDACIHDGFLALVDIDESIATKDFLFHTLSTLREQFEKGATHGGVFTNLTTTSIDLFEIRRPEIPEQQRIADCLTSLDDLIVAQTQKHEALKTHKKGLMQQLFPSPEAVAA
jgi:type I restriction enzyme, S subunit